MKVWVAIAPYIVEREIVLMFSGVGVTKEGAVNQLLEELKHRWNYEVKENENEDLTWDEWLSYFHNEDGDFVFPPTEQELGE